MNFPFPVNRPTLALLTSILLMTACSSSSHGPIRTESYVDIKQFMGDWYVIACIPTMFETEAYNAVESYELKPDGRIATTFTYNKGGFDGPRKTMTPTGFVEDDPSNAVWGMQFIWPIKAEYRIVYVDDAYSETIVGRTKRDYVWIMARTPQISEARYQHLVNIVADQGYDISELRKVPQEER